MEKFVTSENTILKLSGSPYDIGFKHGSSMKHKVHISLRTYEKMFKETSGYSWEVAREKALLHLEAIQAYNQDYITEMEGLAAGAGVQFEDILTLNARSEIALTHTPDGCTSFAMTTPRTSKTWLAQNWDWKGTQIDSLIHVEIEKKGLPTIQMITEAGIIGKIGCNSAGIGVGLNALVTDTWQAKIPIHLGLRAILESSSFEEAVSSVDKNQMASPAHFLISSHIGQIAGMEVSPIHTQQIPAVNGMLAHTNHICSTEMKQKVKEETVPDSYHRLNEIEKQITSLEEKDLTIHDVFHLLSNHENYPNSICRHVSEERPEGSETVFSIVMDLTDNRLTWLEGKPCEHVTEV